MITETKKEKGKKGSGIEGFVKLKDVCSYSKGKKPSVLSPKSTKDCSIPYINIKAFEKGLFDEYTNGVKCNLCEEGDLLMVWDGARAGLTGKAKKGAVGSTLMKIEPKEGLNKDYLFYFLQSNFRKLNTNPRGVGIPHVEPTLLWDSKFILPNEEDQLRIVSKISEIFSEIDHTIDNLNSTRQQVSLFRNSVLNWAFEGRFTNKNIKIGVLPKNWSVKKLGEIAIKITDGEHITPKRTSEGFLLLSARNIQNGYLKLKNVDYVPKSEYERIIKRCNPEEGDILISCSGSVGRVCRVPANLKFTLVRSVALVKLNYKEYSSKYFEYLFQSPLLQSQIEKGKKATAQANLFLSPIKNLNVLICDLNEQNKIVEEIENRLSVADKIEEAIEESLLKAESMKQSILIKAFNGKLI